MKEGDAVIYVDPLGNDRPAVLTAVWGSGPTPAVNLVFVSDDQAKKDTYGRQIERATSVVHQSGQAAPGNYWREAAPAS